MLNFNDLLSSIKDKNRPVFHSEDDFKFSLSQVIVERYPNFSVRLERPTEIPMLYRNGEQIIVRSPIDIILVDEIGNTIPIELKYKTKKAVFDFNNEEYSLLNHSANDVGRYSFRKDIYRIEKYLEKQTNSKVGYVLILTNDENYSSFNAWDKNNIDKHFTFHQGAIIPKKDESWNFSSINKAKYYFDVSDKKWKYKGLKKNHWTCSGELFYRLDLKNNYIVNWQLYSEVYTNKFEYCLLEIRNNN
jgi:hypothetical protein